MTLAALRRIERLNYVLGGVAIIAAAIAFHRALALGVVVGVVLSCANFSVMRVVARRAMRAPEGKRGAQSFFMLPKMAALMALVFLAMWFLPIEALGLILGFSVFLVSIAVETVRIITTPPASDESGDGEGDARGNDS